MVEQDLGQDAAEGMSHDDRWLIEIADDALVMLDDAGDGQRLDRRGVCAQRLDLDLEAGVGGGEHPVAAACVAVDPVLPAARGHPQSVDQHNRVSNDRERGTGSHDSLLNMSTRGSALDRTVIDESTGRLVLPPLAGNRSMISEYR
jgi:hypothetical protein